MATLSSILAWEIPWTEEQTTVHGVAKNWRRLSASATIIVYATNF